jgi:beta-lactamase regulating signal transducer with metallopeptidase domain
MNALVANHLIEAVGWSLLSSLWQCALVALIAAAGLKLRGSRSSKLNYSVYCLALVVALLWSAGTFGAKVRPSERRQLSAINFPRAEPGRFAPGSDITAAPPSNSGGFDLNRAMPTLVTAWILGVLLMSMRLLVASRWIKRLRRSALPWDNREWQEKFRGWSDELGLRRAAKLCATTLMDVPAVIGHWKPIVLLPAAILTQLTPRQLEAVIMHELMHIRRNDYLVNLLQMACEILFFFNPAIWWLSRSIRVERENCCDDLVAARAGGGLAYAKALVRLEELRLAPSSAPVLAVSGGSFKVRIARLLHRPSYTFPAGSGAACIGLLLVMALAVAWPRAVAQEKQDASFELRSVVPDGTAGAEVLPFKRREGAPQQLSVARRVLLDNTHFEVVTLTDDLLNKKLEITVALTKEGAALFTRITRDHIGRQIAIIIDRTIVSAPVVNEAITGGSFAISGDFTREEATELVKKLQPKTDQAALPNGTRITAPKWTPPPGALPSAILREAQAEHAAGRHEEALARFVWYHGASRDEPGQGGVRTSFALGYWLKLGQDYPPALDKLKEVRDQTGDALRERNGTADHFTLFQEYASINRTLRDEEKTTELFLWLDLHDPKVARGVYDVAEPSLIKSGEFELCGKYLKPENFKRILANFQYHKDRAANKTDSHFLNFGENKFRNEAASLIALLVVNGDQAAAERIAGETLRAWDDPKLKTMVEAALRGDVPDPWP